LLSRELGQEVSVTGLERLTGGSSREIWAFTGTGAGARRELVLRRDPPGEVRPGGAEAERGVMTAARDAGVTVPEILALAAVDDADLPGGGLVMERVVGESVPRRVLSTPDLADARSGLADRCGRELGRLHTIDPGSVAGLPDEDRLVAYRRELDRLDDVRPVLELAHAWLERHRPPAREPVVVHGDFRLGNLVVDPHGLVAVLDWESAHRGDRLEDLGWVAVKAWRFRGPGLVGGFGSADDLLAAYRQVTGVEIPAPEFEWAVVLGTWVWAVGCLVQANRHLSGATTSVDLAVVGRRVVEIEQDLLELVA
jgi:aminoglycoside phosphotransferase (APT) family kinase protein